MLTKIPPSAVSEDHLSSKASKSKPFSQANVSVITLGCPKNQVDSEVMAGVLRDAGFCVTPDLQNAEIVIVNTCGFLESAVKESIQVILDVSLLKRTGRLKKIIMTGCVVERYRRRLHTLLPEVDAFVTTRDILSVGVAAKGRFSSVFKEASRRPCFLYDEMSPRIVSTGSSWAYVKISEGCNRSCSFCVIPKIRGKMRSRTIASIVAEIKDLGVSEANLIAQDLTSFGLDRKDETLSSLLAEIDKARAVPWIRLLYAYPSGVSRELLTTICELDSVCDYLDIPFQHCSEKVLRKMKRPLGRFSPKQLIELIRAVSPNIALRTAFIVGFPGETERDVLELESFIQESCFHHIGIFTFSREEGTISYKFRKQIPEEEKEARRDHLMRIQRNVAAKLMNQYVGQKIPVLVTGLHEDTDFLLSGRARFQAPEVDGNVIINDLSSDVPKNILGKIVTVEITEASGYDLVGRVIGNKI